MYLGRRVDNDSVVGEKGEDTRMKSFETVHVCETILANQDIGGCRIPVPGTEDVGQRNCIKEIQVWLTIAEDM
jgi:hypothetical protein